MLKAKVYWNFHRKCFSVQINGRVVAHATDVILWKPRFRVGRAGRARVLREKRKNVHAFVYGQVAASMEVDGQINTGHAVYNPYAHETFVDRIDGHAVRSADVAVCYAREGRPNVWYATLGGKAGDSIGVRFDR